MYGVKRNIKMNPQISKGVKKVEPMVNRAPRKFKSNGYGKYKFPNYDEVPSGEYFSKIIHAEDSTTSTGNYAVEVLYEIRDFSVCYKIANGMIDDDGKSGIFYIKMKISENSQYFQPFIDSMSEALDNGDEEFVLADLKGITEHIKLGYNGDFANYIDRFPYKFEWYVDENLNNNDDVEDDYLYGDEE